LLYRAGRHEESLKRLHEAFAGGTPTPHDCLFVALNHRELNHPADAAKWLEEAKRRRQLAKDNELREPAKYFWAVVELDLLMKEAE
jgi:hypothetical protein